MAQAVAAGAVAPAQNQHTLASQQTNLTPAEIAEQLQGHPLNAGLRVDLILALCQQGQRVEAQQVLRDLQALGSLPAGIQQMLSQVFAQACPQAPEGGSTKTTANNQAVLQASSMLGWASNVNAAPKPKGIALGEAGALGYYTFAPSSRPKGSGFAELGLDYSRVAPWLQLPFLRSGEPRLGLSASARGYGSARGFNTVYLAGQLAWPMQGNQSLQLQLGHWQLGGRGYETRWGLVYERYGVPWLQALGQGFWGVQLEQTQVLQDGRFDANRLALHLGASQNLGPAPIGGSGFWAWSVGPVYEESVFQRPGGHRLGLRAKALLQLPNSLGQARVALGLGLLNDQDNYNQALFGGLKRERKEIDFSMQQTFRPFSGLQPFMGLNWVSTNDTIDLFTVESLQIHLGLSHTW